MMSKMIEMLLAFIAGWILDRIADWVIGRVLQRLPVGA